MIFSSGECSLQIVSAEADADLLVKEKGKYIINRTKRRLHPPKHAECRLPSTGSSCIIKHEKEVG